MQATANRVSSIAAFTFMLVAPAVLAQSTLQPDRARPGIASDMDEHGNYRPDPIYGGYRATQGANERSHRRATRGPHAEPLDTDATNPRERPGTSDDAREQERVNREAARERAMGGD